MEFYFTDSGIWPDSVGAVYHVDDKGNMRLFADSLSFPNGIALDNDRNRVYVAESSTNRVMVIEIIEPGKAGEMEVFAQLPQAENEGQWNIPDGMHLDEQGNVFVAHLGMRRIQVLNPSGELIRSYDTKFDGPLNVVQRKTEDSMSLYVVGSVVGAAPWEEGFLVKIDF